MHHDERRAAAKLEQKRKLTLKVDNAVHYHSITRASSSAEVELLLRGNPSGTQVELLLEQIKHRTVGCGFTYVGVVESLHSSLKTEERRDALKLQLLKMIQLEVSDGDKYAVPEEPSVPDGVKGFAVTVRKLGPITRKREEHEEALARRAAEMVQTEDDATLVALEEKYIGKRFIDTDGGSTERREIEAIEWNDDRCGVPAKCPGGNVPYTALLTH